MKTAQIPGTDLSPSVLALGTVPVGSTLGQTESFALLDRYLEAGGTFIDTARVYSDWLPGERSSSEKMIGRWLATRKNRGSFILATKGGHPPLDDMHHSRLSSAEIRHDLESSLHDLGAGHIDLYWLHRDDPAHPVEDVIDTLDALVNAGHIRHYGASNWSAERIAAANVYAEQSGKRSFVANQMMWSLAAPNPAGMLDDTLVDMDTSTLVLHTRTGLSAVPYTSQAHGFFSGRYERGAAPPDSPAARSVQRLFYNDANFARLERVREVSVRLGWSPTVVVLAYLRAQPFPVFPIIGPRTLDQLEDSLPAGDLTLDAEGAEWLECGASEAALGSMT